MSRTHLLLTLTEEKLREASQGALGVNIDSLVETVPSAVVVSGDPRLSVHVEVDTAHAADIARVVKGVCTVDPYREMKLLGGGVRRSARRFFGR